MKRYFSFTLVEILAVTVLVSLLAAIGFAGYGYAMNASRRAATESLIQQISAGLENFKIKNGYYPASASYAEITVGQNGDFITAITWGTTSWKANGTAAGSEVKTFLKTLDQEKLKKSISGGKFVDSWGGVIYYRYPGKVNTTGFDLIAPGEDGQFATAGETKPVDEAGKTSSETLAKYKEGSEWACDDISNFMDK